VSLIWKSPSVLRRPCVGVTPSRVAGEENRCRAAASRAARTFLCLHRPAGGGGAAGGWLPRCAASRRSRRYGHVVLIAGERGIQAHAVRDDRVFEREDGDATRDRHLLRAREVPRTRVLICEESSSTRVTREAAFDYSI